MESFLILTAEIAIALAGFSGVVVAFVGHEQLRYTKATRDKLSSLLGFSAVVLFASLGPLVGASLAGSFESQLWATSSLAWVVINSISSSISLRTMIKNPPDAEHRKNRWAIVVIGALPIPFMLANALIWHEAAVYFYALVAFLGLGFYEFTGLIRAKSVHSGNSED